MRNGIIQATKGVCGHSNMIVESGNAIVQCDCSAD
jgi:hypothetical protein